MNNLEPKFRTKFHAYQQLNNGLTLYIYFTADYKAVYYKFSNQNNLSKRCKLYFTQNYKKLYFIAKRRNYYIDDFTFCNNFIPQI